VTRWAASRASRSARSVTTAPRCWLDGGRGRRQVWQAKYQQDPLAVGGGRVYHSYLPERNDDKRLELRPDLPVHASFDFNYNPGMHAIAGQHLAAADVITACHEVHGPYMRVPACLTGDDRAARARRQCESGKPFPWPELRVYGDPAGHQNRAETTETAWQQVRNTLGVGRVARRRSSCSTSRPGSTR
jgi:hypothetical protein